MPSFDAIKGFLLSDANGAFIAALLTLIVYFIVRSSMRNYAVKRSSTATASVVAQVSETSQLLDSKAIEDIGGAMARYGLAEPWLNFAENMVQFDDLPGKLIPGEPPERDFNGEVLAALVLKPRDEAARANNLLGMGLLITFGGLIAAVFAAAGTLASPEPQIAVPRLLVAAGWKFAASILGLALSMRYSIALNHCRQIIDAQARDIRIALRRRFPALPQLCLVSRSEQKLGMIAGNVDLATSAIDGMADRMHRISQDTLQRMTDQFGLYLQDQAGRQITAAADNLAELTRTIGEVTSTLGAASSALAGSVEEAGAALLQTAREADQLVRGAALESAAAAASVLKATGAVAATLDKMAETAGGATQAMLAGVAAATGTLDAAMIRMAEHVAAGSSAATSAAATLDASRTALRAAEQRHLEESTVRLDEVAAQVERGNVALQAVRMAEKAHAAAARAQIGAIGRRTEQAGAALNKMLSTAAGAQAAVREAHDAQAVSLSSTADRVAEVSREVEASVTALADAAQQAQIALLAAEQDRAARLAAEFDAMNTRSTTLRTALEATAAKVAADLAHAADSLGSSIGLAVERLEGSVSRLAAKAGTEASDAARLSQAPAAPFGGSAEGTAAAAAEPIRKARSVEEAYQRRPGLVPMPGQVPTRPGG